ncbi:hypothetical protein BGZ57DRAFT_913873 [Hyaloscypha finlandica]|nr:hypothetical protein BGZ57DRAFT_913873 [Hyaloscypha finlandica]
MISCTKKPPNEADTPPDLLQASNQQTSGVIAKDIEGGKPSSDVNNGISGTQQFLNYTTFILMNILPLVAGLFGGADLEPSRPFLGLELETRQIIVFSLAGFWILAGLIHGFYGPWIKLSTFGMHLHLTFSFVPIFLAIILGKLPSADLKPWAALLFTLWIELAFWLTRLVADVASAVGYAVAKACTGCFGWCRGWWWFDSGFCPRAPPNRGYDKKD